MSSKINHSIRSSRNYIKFMRDKSFNKPGRDYARPGKTTIFPVAEKAIGQKGESMNNELITIKQLPIIEEELRSVKVLIESETAAVLAMEVNEDTYKEVKKETRRTH